MGHKINFEQELKALKQYLSSKENIEICKPFLSDCERLSAMANSYQVKIEKNFNQLLNSVKRYEYAVGGEVLHRGYYCPSPILDIVIGNCNRGKLLTRLTKRSNPIYRYGFDNENRLITIEWLNSSQKEMVFYYGDSNIGIGFSPDFEVQWVSECTYQNNNIQSYIFCLYSSYENRAYEYTKETYHYSTEGLDIADLYLLFSPGNQPGLLDHHRYFFSHNEDGYLSQYTCCEYKGNEVKDTIWKDHLFDVHLNRKV